jgi:sulfonate transport system permease protein
MAERKQRRSFGINMPGCLVIVLLLAAWEAAIRSGALAFDYLPAPSDILTGTVSLITEGLLVPDILHTLGVVLLGWSVASLIGLALGTAFGVSPMLRRYALASVDVLRPLPGVALAPVALLLFGFSLETELAIMIVPAIWPVLVNTMSGLEGVHARLGEVGRTLHLSSLERLRSIILPAAMPAIFVGLRIGLGLTLVLAVLAEIVGNPAGLGYGILREQQSMRPDLMFAYIAIVGLLGLVLNAAIVGAARLVFPYAVQAMGATR